MFENQPARLKSPWSSAKAQGLLALAMGTTFIARGFLGGTLNWYLFAAGAVLVFGGLYSVAVVARRPESTRPPDFSGPWVQEAKRTLAMGDKIGAIKAVRRATNLGLAEAKDIVEAWERERPEAS